MKNASSESLLRLAASMLWVNRSLIPLMLFNFPKGFALFLIRKVRPEFRPVIDFYFSSPAEKYCISTIYDELSSWYPCRFIDRRHNMARRGSGFAAVITSHQGRLPPAQITKLLDGYTYLFYLPHDLSSTSCWNEALNHFDILFCPTHAHYLKANEIYGKRAVRIPLPRLDAIRSGSTEPINLQPYGNMASLPHPTTIVYAPSYSLTGEWKTIFHAISESDLPVNVIFKSYPYRRCVIPERILEKYRFVSNFKEIKPTRDLSAYDIFHELCARESDRIESHIQENGNQQFFYVDRETNLALLFPNADALVSDASSSLMEFSEFNPDGLALETGMRNSGIIKPTASQLPGSTVEFCPADSLVERLRGLGNTHRAKRKKPNAEISGSKLATSRILEIIGKPQ